MYITYLKVLQIFYCLDHIGSAVQITSCDKNVRASFNGRWGCLVIYAPVNGNIAFKMGVKILCFG